MENIDSHKLVSIIIPVYNTEQYLRRCLDSCVNQVDVTSDDYEIIAVNDGSTDRCVEILDEYRLRYPKLISVISQVNKGQSAARNAGIRQSVGEYVWFVDSDDYISPSAISCVSRRLGGAKRTANAQRTHSRRHCYSISTDF